MKSREIPILIISLIFLIAFIPFVSPAPSKFSGTSTFGLDIEHPYINPIPVNETFKFHFHVFNASTGIPIKADKKTANCTFHLYNSSGSHILKVNDLVSSDDIYDFEQIVTGENFTNIGQYAYVFACNTSYAGGYYANTFLVSNSKMELPTSESIIYSVLTLSILLLFLISLYFSVSLNYKNGRNEKGQVTKISYSKYLKVGLILVSYSLFLWFLNLLVSLSNNFVSLSTFYGLISGLFFIMLKGFYPVMIITFIWIIVLAVKDINFKSLMREFNLK
jgi:hypothetical protein